MQGHEDYGAARYSELEQRVAAWATDRADVRGVVVVGSRARLDHPADDWSDLDLILFTTEINAYTRDENWLTQIGDTWLSAFSRTGRGDPEWLVLFQGGLKGDFVFITLPEAQSSLQSWLEGTPYHFVLARGVRVLVDKSQPPTRVLGNFDEPRLAPPTAGEFRNLVHLTLLDATRTASFLKRGDLWRAKHLCDVILKQRLLTCLEWHAHATHGLNRDTWHDGRYLAEWADPRALAALPEAFARYDEADLWRALFATLDLIHWLSRETADRLGYSYPTNAEDHVLAWLDRLHQ